MTTVNLPSTMGAEATADSGFLGSVAAWLTTTDHKRIGRLFIGTAALWLLAFVGVASLLGFERIDSKSLTLNEGMMTQLFAASKTLASFGVFLAHEPPEQIWQMCRHLHGLQWLGQSVLFSLFLLLLEH